MISIVIPVYKSEKTLGKCLESLMAQTYPEIEMICVIDGGAGNKIWDLRRPGGAGIAETSTGMSCSDLLC